MKRFKEYTDDSINEAKTKLPYGLVSNSKGQYFTQIANNQLGGEITKKKFDELLPHYIEDAKRSYATFYRLEESINEAKIAFINTELISERIQKSSLLPLLGKNNVSLNKDKMDFTKELSSTLIKLYKKYSSLPVK